MSEHYFTARPVSAAEQRPLRVRLADRDLEVVTAGGIFSPEHVDHGTQVLLDHAPLPPSSGDLLDIGCGWGPILLTLGLLSPGATVWGVDTNERALGLAQLNARRAGLHDVHVLLPDAVPADQGFDLIWSNPPIRIGKAALHQLLLTWIPRLRPGGAAYLVVQRNLGSDSLQRWLAEQLSEPGWSVARAHSAKGFRVLEVRRAA